MEDRREHSKHRGAHGARHAKPQVDRIEWEIRKEENIVKILSGPRGGWREVQVQCELALGGTVRAAAMKHCSTLERLQLHGSNGFTQNEIVQILRESPKLHTLHDAGNRNDPMRAASFID